MSGTETLAELEARVAEMKRAELEPVDHHTGHKEPPPPPRTELARQIYEEKLKEAMKVAGDETAFKEKIADANDALEDALAAPSSDRDDSAITARLNEAKNADEIMSVVNEFGLGVTH